MPETQLRAYHGDPAIKEHYLARVRAHRAADEIVQGYGYWQDGRGCAVGCTIHGSDHAAYEAELGVPRQLAHLEDRLFENLPPDRAREWPESFLSAIPVGADLQVTFRQFMLWLLADPDEGVIRFATTEQTRKAIEAVATLYRRALN